ncbi:2-hydroxyethylphosphonate dioxygenase [Magnetospirillum sp. XM-1]|uniref:hypothetical protein n=1 Tax=Magnetospirillum sp. XM-1 TaxID=1663591 RepID=UPI00073DF1B2|nr:hypothetical protein [Magnetospirillum sp. XM-1]CUW38007.1 2-hydroxyethylphosphonate dioxygenase [Magnetospirillum sp. XM-1]
MTITINRYKLMHWLNARKVTPIMAAERAGLTTADIDRLLTGTGGLESDAAQRLAGALHVPEGYLSGDDSLPAVIYASRKDVEATCRPVDRDGIHFYNYYTLPSPKGLICPVILDILCPADKLPKQNNGHLEPAITVNIGPGDINGRWDGRYDEGLNNDTWQVMHHNRGAESWVLGDSYVEPSFCPHTYSLAGTQPAQILSYTIKTSLEAFLAQSNAWSDHAFKEMLGSYEGKSFPGRTLLTHMDRRGFDAASLSKASGIGLNALTAFLDGDEDAIAIPELKRLGGTLGCDWRLLLAPVHANDSVGKTWASIEDSVASIRPYKSYTVASLAMGARVPDMIGLFMKVAKPEDQAELDLVEPSATHYLVSGGAMTLRWMAEDGSVQSRSLEYRDALWIGPYVRHSFAGQGSLVKMGNGEGVSYLNQFELSNTFELADTLKRGRHDLADWGYDAGAEK